MGEKDYTGKDIKVLEGLEGVRHRPSMYIGSTSKYGLHKLVDEVVDNSVDEAMAGYCTDINITLNSDGSVTVEDNGRGIPIDTHPVYKIPTVEVVITKLHAGGKFDKGSYKISGGLHGVGISVVAALSKSFKVVIRRDGKIYQQEYEIGKPIYKLKTVGNCDKGQTGTTITFTPDDTIFSATKFDFSILETRFREIAFLNKGLKINLADKIADKKEVFKYEGGLLDFVKWVNRTRQPIHAKPVYFLKEQDGVFIECAVQYNDGYQENVLSFVNTINTIEGGTHVVGFKTALTRAINDYGNKNKLLKDGNFTGDDVREGLTVIISVKVPEPQFEGQTKTKLGNSEVKGIVDSISMTSMTEFFEENPQVARKIVDKAIEGQKARNAAKKAKELVRRKNAFSVGGLPGKLADCSSNKTEETELYLVEGDSAGGCFSGDTEVALADGRDVSFKDLVEEYKKGKQNFCYTIKSDGSVGINKILHPRVTKKDAEVIKIVLDNDQEIICTPDHKFMLRDQTYREAKDLTIEDSLMPLYEKEVNIIPRANHKIERIESLDQRMDVYDMEVPGTHNFALASGIFVHNSAKQARNKEFQAILPLKGKILNVEKAQAVKVLSNEEIGNLITGIGAGITDQFDINKLRYAKIIIMSVDGQETSFIQTPHGETKCIKIGEFIDSAIENKWNISKYKILCFNLKTRKSQFKPIKAVIRHPIDEPLYEIKTSYGRNVKITSSHSVFVYEDDKVKLKKGNEIKRGDKIVAPKNLPLYNYDYSKKIDILSILIKNKHQIKGDVYVRGNSIIELLKCRLRQEHKDDDNLVGERVIIPETVRQKIKSYRKKKKISQQFICENVGIKQPCVYYDWENGKNKPTLKKFERYIETLGMDKNQVLSQVQIVKSSIDNTWDKQYKNSGRNRVKDYISVVDLEEADLDFIGEEITIFAEHYFNQGIERYVPVNESFMKIIGFWLAEGSWSVRNGIRLAIGNNNVNLVPELSASFKEMFGLSAKLSYAQGRQTCGELKIVNKVAALFWKFIFNLEKSSSLNQKIDAPPRLKSHGLKRCSIFGCSKCRPHSKECGFRETLRHKEIPSIIFNISKELQLEFLRTYFLGDGTLSKHNISFTTISRNLADQLLYLLQSFGVMASLSERDPGSNNLIVSKNRVYTVSINSKKDLLILKKVWQDHRNASLLQAKIESNHCSINRKFETISEDLVGLEVKEIRNTVCSGSDVYDFSVEDDENFIAGFGGLCCHNTDADVDGAHIRTLLLTFFFRFMHKLIENGNVYIAVSPLYRVRKRGDHYVYSEKELKELLSKITGNTDVQRFKGLGEMNPEQLWETTMNPKTRMLKKVVIQDGVKADEVFSKLMGDNVEPRKQFIAEHASEAQIDI